MEALKSTLSPASRAAHKVRASSTFVTSDLFSSSSFLIFALALCMYDFSCSLLSSFLAPWPLGGTSTPLGLWSAMWQALVRDVRYSGANVWVVEERPRKGLVLLNDTRFGVSMSTPFQLLYLEKIEVQIIHSTTPTMVCSMRSEYSNYCRIDHFSMSVIT